MNNLVRPEPPPLSGAQRARQIVVALLCILYLLNMSGGWVEIPDCLPVIGNLGEVAATVVLMGCLERLGIYPMPEC